MRLERRKIALKAEIANQVRAVADPANSLIRDELINAITEMKEEQKIIERDVSDIETALNEDEDKFMKFALDFVNDSGKGFLALSRENRMKCKQLIFPSGLFLKNDKKVYTPEISIFYRLKEIKKDIEMSQKAQMVRDS